MRNSMTRLLFAAVLRPVHRRLAQYVDRMRGMNGRRWQRRFFSLPLDDRHTATVFPHVKLNSMPAAERSAWAGTLPGVMAGKRPPRMSPRVDLVGEAESFQWDMADTVEYAANGGGAGCGSERLTVCKAETRSSGD